MTTRQMQNVTQAAIYARVSSKEQEKEGFSIPAQQSSFEATQLTTDSMWSANSLISRRQSEPDELVLER
ncbi:MAG: hypothetical protein ACR2NN_19540 [Bryobacteraceae bacterium]